MADKLYFAYGSNINLEQMDYRCPDATVVGPVVLENYELLFRRGGFATIAPKEGGRVHGLLWSITPECERSLDLYEGYPRFYGKEMMDVELDGKTISAMVYVMTPGQEFGIPSDHYANVIWEGYESAGFDTQVLEDAINHAYELTFRQEQQNDSLGQQSLFGFGGWSGIK